LSKLEAQTNNVETKVNNLESKIDELITNQKHVISLLEKLTEHNLQFRSQVAFSFIDFLYIIMDEIKKPDSQKENVLKLTNSISGNSYYCLRLILNKPLAYSSTEMHKNLKLNTIQERSKYLHEKYIKESKENNPMIKKCIQ
jgi:hypothetical protein